jgi:alkanesulfonate monooxygenase SsuD/methylene tetrahydromethanopterin reductase-like flavin-dependent oxidoreductase (luciferase family)
VSEVHFGFGWLQFGLVRNKADVDISICMQEILQRRGPPPHRTIRQRTPFFFQAGASKAGKVFATKHAEAMFLPGMHIESVRKSVLEIRQTAVEQGRDLRGLKLIVGMLVIVDETDELAQRK